MIRKVFGTPGHVYHVGGITVLVWHKNLLADVQAVPSAPPGHGSAPPSGA